MKFKRTRILSGTLMAPLMIGGRALLYHDGKLIRTSTVVAIRSSGAHHIRFETMNTIYILLTDPTPQAAGISAGWGLAA